MLIVDDSQVPTAPTKAVVDGQGGGGGMEGKEGSKVQVGMRVGEGMEGPMLEMLEMEDLEAKEEQELPVGMGGCWILCPFSIQYWYCGNICAPFQLISQSKMFIIGGKGRIRWRRRSRWGWNKKGEGI